MQRLLLIINLCFLLQICNKLEPQTIASIRQKNYQKYIEEGFQFTRLAVQEPYGVMVLKVSHNIIFMLT